jgi:ribonuclease P protein component
MMGPTGRFRRGDRLQRSSEFGRVSREGSRAVEAAFVLLVAPGRAGGAGGTGQRLGITVSRKVGGAVVRNRVKRRVREWFRRCRSCLRTGIDLVVIGRSEAARLSRQESDEALCRLARRAGAARA